MQHAELIDQHATIVGCDFLKAFNKAYEEYGHDESRAFAVAHHAAKQAGKKEQREASPTR